MFNCSTFEVQHTELYEEYLGDGMFSDVLEYLEQCKGEFELN